MFLTEKVPQNIIILWKYYEKKSKGDWTPWSLHNYTTALVIFRSTCVTISGNYGVNDSKRFPAKKKLNFYYSVLHSVRKSRDALTIFLIYSHYKIEKTKKTRVFCEVRWMVFMSYLLLKIVRSETIWCLRYKIEKKVKVFGRLF